MKLQIGDTIKQLRWQRGMTQEQLAAVLEVSCQSVSRWELNVCYPDMELLPVIANYFDVTVDQLQGMDRLRSEQRKREIFTRALNLERQGDWDGAIGVLRDAAKTYPNDDGFLGELALALTKTGKASDRREAISLSETVLSRSTNEKLRSTVGANLCFLYKAAGQTQKAMESGRSLPHIWECREVLLPDLVPEEQRRETVLRGLNIAVQVLGDVDSGTPIPFSLGYKREEAVDTTGLEALLKRN